MASCDTFAILQVTDGSTTVDLLNKDNGFLLFEWTPQIASFKDGGIFQNSPLATGRRLVAYRYDNAIETMQLKGHHVSADAMIEESQTLRRLLQKAADYWATDWQNVPVYVKALARGETNTRYCLIHTGRLGNDANPYAQPFLQARRPGYAVMDDIPFIFERGDWLGNAPGTTSSVPISSQQLWTTPEWDVETTTPSGDVTALYELADGTLLAGTDDSAKIFRSTDGGATWSLWHTLSATATDIVQAFHQLRTNPLRIRALVSGTQHGVWKSNDGGGSFANDIAPFNDFYDVLQSEFSGWNIYTSDSTVLIRSADGDDEVTTSSVGSAGWSDVLGIAEIPSNGDLLFIEADNIRSADYVVDFSSLALEYNHGSSTFRCIHRLSSGRILAGLEDGTVVRSDDDGDNWTSVTDTVTGGAYSLTQGLDGIVYAGGASSIWASYNGGENWVQVSSDPSIDVVALLTKANGEIYAGDSGQVLVQEYQNYTAITEQVTNGHLIGDITHIKSADSTSTTFIDRFPNPTLPYPIWFDPPSTADQVYIGISEEAGGFTFSSVVFNFTTPGQGRITPFIDYWDGSSWAFVDVQDNTIGPNGPLSATGQVSYVWEIPSDWAITTVDGVSARWVRISIQTGNITPYQGEYNAYAMRNAYVEIADSAIAGDLPALLQMNIQVLSDEALFDIVPVPDAHINRALIGLRSVSRGSRFNAYLNASDQGNDPSVLVIAGTDTTFADDIRAPSNRRMEYSPTTTGSWVSVATFTLAGDLVQEYYGTFHCFLRCRQSGGIAGQVDFRLRTSTGSGGVQIDTLSKTLTNTNDHQFIDFGRLTIPVSSLLNTGETGDEANIIVQCNASSITPDIHFYDLVLLPIDEWAGDFTDKENSAVSPLTGGYYLDVDSATFPKRSIRAQVRDNNNNQIKSVFQTVVNGEAILQANSQQRLWFMFAKTESAGGSDWRSEPWMAAKITLNANQRYLGMRGAR